ncbi:MAG: hypothetical protein LBS01_04320 [Prevotellaceae bacterium]|jgi:predicted transposase YdaD|nr:hypothetical protein [Prevotellaceae bacterium]
MKSRNLLLLIAVFAFVQSATSQNKPPSFEDMTNRKWQEISVKAQLTDEEKRVIYPFFMEHESAMFKLIKNSLDAVRKVKDNQSKSENVNFAEINDLYVYNEIKQGILLKEYHEKLKKILSPEKLFNFYMAERTFKKQLMQNAGHRHNKK